MAKFKLILGLLCLSPLLMLAACDDGDDGTTALATGSPAAVRIRVGTAGSPSQQFTLVYEDDAGNFWRPEDPLTNEPKILTLPSPQRDANGNVIGTKQWEGLTTGAIAATGSIDIQLLGGIDECVTILTGVPAVQVFSACGTSIQGTFTIIG